MFCKGLFCYLSRADGEKSDFFLKKVAFFVAI